MFLYINKYNLMGAGILPVALYRGTLFMLLGQERNNHLWSDFGGSANKNEKPKKTAIREGTEELNGFFGTEEELESHVENNFITSICYNSYTSYVFNTRYDKNLVKYFKNTNRFAEKHLQDKITASHNGLFEKKEIRWIPVEEFKNKEKLAILRPHYVEIIKQVVKRQRFIINHIEQL